jgi:hypothetical protein
MAQKDDKLSAIWDRWVILLTSQPREGWEDIFEEIKRRELERLCVPNPTEPEDAADGR